MLELIFNWKTILALTVFTLPMAYCSVEDVRHKNSVVITCIENQGTWNRWHQTCEFSND